MMSTNPRRIETITLAGGHKQMQRVTLKAVQAVGDILA
jgi:hypothetical protein